MGGLRGLGLSVGASFALVVACGEDSCIDPLGHLCTRAVVERPLAGEPSAGVRVDIDGDGIEEVALLSLAADLLWVIDGEREVVIGELGSPLALAVTDLNRDGLGDIVVASGSPPQLIPLQSRGDGTFERGEAWPLDRAAHDLIAVELDDGESVFLITDGEALALVSLGGKVRTLPLTVAAIEVEAGDLDDDGRLDLVGLDLEGSLTSALGDGMGGFSGTSSITITRGVRDLALGDYNGDGQIDALVRDPLQGGFIVAIGDGAGGFAEPKALGFGEDTGAGRGLASGGYSEGAGLASVSMAIGALRTVFYDGSDRAVAHVEASVANPFTLLGDGVVASERSVVPIDPQSGPVPVIVDEFALGVDIKSLAVADFTGDGAADLAVARSPCNTSIFRGDGAGGVSEELESGPLFQLCPTTVLAADINRDGVADLVAQDESGIQLALGDGDGGFNRGAFHSAEYSSLLPILSDATNSTLLAVRPDGAIAPLAADDTGALSLLLGWTPPGEIASSGAGDLDGDGNDELIVTIGSRLSVLRLGAESLVVVQEHRLSDLSLSPTAGFSPFVTVADVDGDGVAEAILDDGASVAVVEAIETPLPSIRGVEPMESGPLEASAGAVVDIDGDGSLDYVRLGPRSIAYLRGDGSVFSRPSLTSDVGHAQAYADLDSDGRTDLLLVEERSTKVRRAEARDVTLPRLGDEYELLMTWQSPVHRDDGDFNGDGYLDIALVDPHSITVHWGDGAGFRGRSSERRDNGADLSVVRAADLDGDGRDELLLGASTSSILGLSWVGPGWSERVRIELPPGAADDLAVSDLDGDGHVDVALAWGPTEDDPRMGVTVFYAEPRAGGEGSSRLEFSEGVTLSAGPYPNALEPTKPYASDDEVAGPVIAIQAADLDGDGRSELLLDGDLDGALRLLWNDGDREFSATAIPGRSALILGPGVLLTLPGSTIVRHEVYGRRVGPGSRTQTWAPHRFGAVTDCNGDGIPDLRMIGGRRSLRSSPPPPGSPFMVGVGHDFMDYPDADVSTFLTRCIDVDGDALPDLVGFGGGALRILYTTPG